MIILYLLGFLGLVAGIVAVIWLFTTDYTKDPKTGKDKKEDINDFLLPK